MQFVHSFFHVFRTRNRLIIKLLVCSYTATWPLQLCGYVVTWLRDRWLGARWLHSTATTWLLGVATYSHVHVATVSRSVLEWVGILQLSFRIKFNPQIDIE